MGWGHPGDPVQLPSQTQISGLSGHALDSQLLRGEPWSVHPTAYFPVLGAHTGLSSGHHGALDVGRKGLWDQEWSEEVWVP